MTRTEFFRNALLLVAGNSAFGKTNFHNTKEWAEEVERAARILLDVAIRNHCLDPDEPIKPP